MGEADTVWLEPASWADRRSAWRWASRAIGFLREPQGRRFQVSLLDLSTTGCRVETDAVRPGQQLWIAIGNLEPRMAHVAWASRQEAGLFFREELHQAVVNHFTTT